MMRGAEKVRGGLVVPLGAMRLLNVETGGIDSKNESRVGINKAMGALRLVAMSSGAGIARKQSVEGSLLSRRKGNGKGNFDSRATNVALKIYLFDLAKNDRLARQTLLVCN